MDSDPCGMLSAVIAAAHLAAPSTRADQLGGGNTPGVTSCRQSVTFLKNPKNWPPKLNMLMSCKYFMCSLLVHMIIYLPFSQFQRNKLDKEARNKILWKLGQKDATFAKSCSRADCAVPRRFPLSKELSRVLLQVITW